MSPGRARKCRPDSHIINCTVARLYNHILTFTKLAAYSASVVKSNLGNFLDINSLINPLGTPLLGQDHKEFDNTVTLNDVKRYLCSRKQRVWLVGNHRQRGRLGCPSDK